MTLNTKISELQVDPSPGVFGHSMYASYVFPSETKRENAIALEQKKKWDLVKSISQTSFHSELLILCTMVRSNNTKKYNVFLKCSSLTSFFLLFHCKVLILVKGPHKERFFTCLEWNSLHFLVLILLKCLRPAFYPLFLLCISVVV